MKKLFIAATLTLALCGVANAGGTAEDIKKVVDAQELKNEQYQNFIWDQELINKSQAESNKQCSDFITSQKDLNSQVVNKLNSPFKAPAAMDEDKYRYRIQSLESDIDRLKSIINKLDSRLYTLERKVR